MNEPWIISVAIIGAVVLAAIIPGVVVEVRCALTGEPSAKRYYQSIIEEQKTTIKALNSALFHADKAVRLEEKENRKKAETINNLKAEIIDLKHALAGGAYEQGTKKAVS